MLKKILKLVCLASLMMTPWWVGAQLNRETSAIENELGVQVSPDYPEPNKPVTLSLSLYTEDLNSAQITWFKNGEKVLTGQGETSYSFNMGGAGSKTSIEISIKFIDGTIFTKKISLVPASVNLFYEANSYVPPFYRGKALYAAQGSVRIVALPNFVKNGLTIAPEKLVYKWSNGSTVYEKQSGYGKNSLVINGSLLGREETIEVLVTDSESSLVATAAINLAPSQPQILFYENNAYYGEVFEKALSQNFDLKNDEVQIVAAPYYFSKEQSGRLKFNWRLNGNSIPELTESRTAIFRKPEESGESVISLNIENLNHALQSGSQTLLIKFQK